MVYPCRIRIESLHVSLGPTLLICNRKSMNYLQIGFLQWNLSWATCQGPAPSPDLWIWACQNWEKELQFHS